MFSFLSKTKREPKGIPEDQLEGIRKVVQLNLIDQNMQGYRLGFTEGYIQAMELVALRFSKDKRVLQVITELMLQTGNIKKS